MVIGGDLKPGNFKYAMYMLLTILVVILLLRSTQILIALVLAK